MIERWEPFVNWPSPEDQIRRNMPLWQWSFRNCAYLVLEPAPGSNRAVFVKVIKDETEKRPDSFDDIPMTRVMVCSPWSIETVISNAVVLGNVSEREALSCTEIPKNLREVAKVKPFCQAESARGHESRDADRNEIQPDSARGLDTRDVSQLVPQNSITLVHRTSGQKKDLQVMGVYASMVRVEWPMSGMYELSKTSGVWRSSPRSLLKLWDITSDSSKLMDEMVLTERAKKRDEFKKQRFEL